MPSPASPYGGKHRAIRDQLLEEDPLCIHCEENPATVADHYPPVSQHEHVNESGCCVYVPSCKPCSDAQGGRLSKTAPSAQKRMEEEASSPEREDTPGPEDDQWQVPWLLALLDVPEDATWPRYMSRPHPLATGSYGEEFEDWWSNRNNRKSPYWFQRLLARRILEHDASGRLVWYRWFFTMARQLGKSHFLRELFVWFTMHVGRFTEDRAEITVLVSRSVTSAEQIIIPAQKWAKEYPELWSMKSSSGRMELSYEGSSSISENRWLVRASKQTYGEPVGLGVMDECWDIPLVDMTEGLEPTILATEGFLGFTSTAHRKATSLVLNLRQEAFEALDSDNEEDPELLILEWSCPRRLDISDSDGWKMASPRWTRRREKVMERRLKAAISGEEIDPSEPDPILAFETQYLNRWPTIKMRRGKGEPLLGPGQWAGCLFTQRPPIDILVAALEDHYGDGCSVAVGGLDAQGVISVTGRMFDSHDDGIAWMGDLEGVEEFLVGASMIGDPRLRDLPGPRASRGSAEVRSAIPRLRQMVKYDGLIHDGEPDLADQILAARIREGPSGISFVPGVRVDFVKAVAWAVERVERRNARTPQVM